MNENLIELLLRYGLPGLLVISSMYWWIKGLKKDVGDIKESLKVIADQQIEITEIRGDLKNHDYRLKQLEK